MLMLFEKQKLQSSHPSGCSDLTVKNPKGACNQGKGGANFDLAQLLVDTRSANHCLDLINNIFKIGDCNLKKLLNMQMMRWLHQ